MRVKLSIKQRLALSSILAQQEGDSACLRLYRKCREDFSLSLEEHTLVGFKTEVGERSTKYEWDVSKDPMKECEINDVVVNVFATYFKKLEDEKKLRDDHLDFYEMFVEKKNA